MQTHGVENIFALMIPTGDLARMPQSWVEGLADLGVRVIEFDGGTGRQISSRMAGVAMGSPGRVFGSAVSVATIARCTHAITLDAGFLPNREDMARLLEASRANPGAIIQARPPRPSPRLAARLPSLLVFLEAGVRVADGGCGLRVYPLRLFEILRARVDPWIHPAEILVRAAWAGCPIIEIPVESGLAAPQETPTPWRKLRALSGNTFMHARLLTRALSGWRHRQYHAGAEAAVGQPFWSGFWRWLNPMRAWRELRQGGASRSEMAAGIAIGVFIANLPAYGVQTLLALYAARRLHLHPAAVVVGSKISTPPVGPILIVAAVWLGHLLLHGSRLTRADFGPINAHLFARMAPMLLDWLVGSVVIGAAMAVAAFAVAKALFGMTGTKDER
ncbi:MAG TPA: DUF2062 domain-containing protein [Tepidisphaeraceae bacterium]|nr:DUF2062 domain-containing protein [Tepidisphaeraceae bacterium]